MFLIKKILKKNSNVRLLCHFSSLKIELKIKKFKRIHFLQNFDKQKCISVSLVTFIDKFKLYRNNYRIFMNVYIIIIVLSFQKQTRRANIFFFIFEPHNNNFFDVVKTLQFFIFLNKKIIFIINDENIFVCIFILLYINDMFQQQNNFEFKN